MGKNVDELNNRGLMFLKRKQDLASEKICRLNVMYGLINYYLDKSFNKGIGLSDDEAYDDVKSYIFQTKFNTIEELQIMRKYFSYIYDITNDLDCFNIKFYLELIIYIRENLENKEELELDLYDFDFTIRSLNKGVLKDMNDYFGVDLIQVVDEWEKEYELRRIK